LTEFALSYSDNKTIAIAAIINPVNKIPPGITPYTINEITIVITGASPVSGTTTIALPYRKA
jgi:hypothetical protein